MQVCVKEIGCSVFLLLAILSANANAGEQPGTPAHYFPVLKKQYVLQSFDGSKKPSEQVIDEKLENQYFYSNCSDSKRCEPAIPAGATIFRVPSGFGSTPNSEFPRSELRATHNFTNGSSFSNEQSGSVYILDSPSTQSIIFAQIHGDKAGGSELFKLRWKNGNVVAGVKEKYGDPEKQVTLLSNVKLKDRIDYTLSATGNGSGIEVSISASSNGRTEVKTFDFPKSSWEGIQLYFKAGNYNQDSKLDGSLSAVAYGKLSVRYN